MCSPGKWGKKSLPMKMLMRIKSSMMRSRSYSNGSVPLSASNSWSRYSRNRPRCMRKKFWSWRLRVLSDAWSARKGRR